jgi:hypothetical protein
MKALGMNWNMDWNALTLGASDRFSNCRDWRTFLSAAQRAVAESGVAAGIATATVAAAASVAMTLPSGHAWLAKDAAALIKAANSHWAGTRDPGMEVSRDADADSGEALGI